MPKTLTPSDSDWRLESAQLVYSELKLVWDDQVELAATLGERRKTMISILAFVVGLGLFKAGISDFSVPKHLTGWQWVEIQILLTNMIVFFLVGTYVLCSDESRVRSSLRRLGRLLKILATRVSVRFGNVGGKDPRSFLEPCTYGATNKGYRRAIEAILPSVKNQKLMHNASPLMVVYFQTAQLRSAYQKLKKSNNRVRKRIQEGSTLICWGYVWMATGLLLFLWSIRTNDLGV